MNKSVLITGAYGFLGRYVALQFSKAGYLVSGLGHGQWPESEFSKYGISSWKNTDISLESLKDYGQKPDVIVHCAGAGSVIKSLNEPYLEFQKAVGSTVSILEYIRTISPETTFIFPSSAAVYGKAEKLPIKERDSINPVSPYGYHKVSAESQIKQYASTYGIKSSIVRLFSLYGPELRKQLLWDASLRLSNGGNTFFGTGEETRDWLHVTDAASLLFLAKDKASSACMVVNGGSGIATKNKKILELLSHSLGLDAPLNFNEEVRSGDPKNYQADIALITKWGWCSKIPLEQGVEEYARWFAKNKN